MFKERYSNIVVRVSIFIIAATGFILPSQGQSFARWNKFNSIEHMINKHAELITFAGIGLFFTAAACWNISIQIKELNARIQKLEG